MSGRTAPDVRTGARPRPAGLPRAAVLLLAVVGVLLAPTAAHAHGEQNQEAFLRASTVLLYDVEFSDTELAVGEELVVTGTIRIMESWPDHTIAPPEVAFLSLVTPGPVFRITDRQMSGTFTPQSVQITEGATYPFRVAAVAREVGEWHIHPSLSVEGVGTLAGRGEWITVTPGSYADTVVLADGQEIQLTSAGMPQIAGWHLIAFVVGLAWVAFWVRRPIIARAAVVDAGRGAALVDGRDRRVAVAFAVVVALVLAGGALYSQAHTEGGLLPLQVARVAPPPLELPEPTVRAGITQAAWLADEDVLEVQVEAVNGGDVPVSFSRLQIAESEVQGFTDVRPDAPVAPGSTGTFILRIDGEALRERNLLPLRDPQIRITGLVFFATADGAEQVAEIDEVTAPVLPR